MKHPAAIAAFAALAWACSPADSHDHSGSDHEVEPVEIDLMTLAIDVERRGVLIQRAHEGAIVGPPAMTAPEEDMSRRAADGLRHAVFDLYRLRALVCAYDLVGPDGCGPLPPPEWLGDPVDYVAPPEELARRLDWLVDASAPFIEAGCDAGESRNTDGPPHFCSVE